MDFGLFMYSSSRRFTLVFLLAATPFLLGAGCINVRVGGGSKGGDGGMWVSQDGGEKWEQKVFVGLDAKKRPQTIGGLNVSSLAFHSRDPNIILLGSREAGLWMSEDKGENWRNIFPSKGEIRVFAPDPTTTTVYYAAVGAAIYRTGDAGASPWELVYREGVPAQVVTKLAVDPHDSANVYATTVGGSLLISRDFGHTWQTIKSFEGPIEELFINPRVPRRIWVATVSRGLWRTEDGGASWVNVIQDLPKSIPASSTIRKITMTATVPETIVYKSDGPLVRSRDGGTTWEQVPLLAPGNTYQFLALAVSEVNPDELYYISGGNLFRSHDAGLKWQTLPLPVARIASSLHVHPQEGRTLIFGGANPPKKKSGLFGF